MNNRIRHVISSGVVYRPIDTKEGKKGYIAQLTYKQWFGAKGWEVKNIIKDKIKTEAKANQILDKLMDEHIYEGRIKTAEIRENKFY